MASQKKTRKYKGVCQHRHTGQWEAHVWMRNGRSPGGLTGRTGFQLYVGGHKNAVLAAHAYDLAALKLCPGARALMQHHAYVRLFAVLGLSIPDALPTPGAVINFPASVYAHLTERMHATAPDEWLAYLRRRLSLSDLERGKREEEARVSAEENCPLTGRHEHVCSAVLEEVLWTPQLVPQAEFVLLSPLPMTAHVGWT